jgi:hypothetical protein
MSDEEAVITRTDIETEVISECIGKKLIEELRHELVSIEGLGQSETLSCCGSYPGGNDMNIGSLRGV